MPAAASLAEEAAAPEQGRAVQADGPPHKEAREAQEAGQSQEEQKAGQPLRPWLGPEGQLAEGLWQALTQRAMACIMQRPGAHVFQLGMLPAV